MHAEAIEVLTLRQRHAVVSATEVDRHVSGHRAQLPGDVVVLEGQLASLDERLDGFRGASPRVITGTAEGQFQGDFQTRAGFAEFIEQAQRPPHIAAILLEQRQLLPQGRRRCCQANSQTTRADTVQAPVQRRAQVFQPSGVTLDPQSRRCHFPIALRLLHQCQAAFGMAFAGFFAFGGVLEFFQCIAAGRVEQTIEHLFVTDFDAQQGFRHQLGDRHKHHAGVDLLADDYRRCGLQRKTTAKHAQTAQAGLLARVEQVETPIQRGAQSKVSLKTALITRCQRWQTALQLAQQPFQAQFGDLRCRQLQRQWNTVESVADFDRLRQLRIAQFKAFLRGRGPFDEQLQRRIFQRLLTIQCRVHQWVFERIETLHEFAFRPQALAAGGEDMHLRRAAQNAFAEHRDGIDQVFAVVEQ
ncbi:hypothetical protein D3C81_985600 [compost metagenome]